MSFAHRSASFEGAGLESWAPGTHSPVGEQWGEREALVGRSRDLARNHPISAGAITALCDNVVGAGPRIQSLPDFEALGRDEAWADLWSSRIEALWRDWADGPACDAHGRLDFARLTLLAFRELLETGDAFALIHWTPGARVRTQILLIDSARVSTPEGARWPRAGDPLIADGVELDAIGRPTAYHVEKAFAGDVAIAPRTWTRVPARTGFGRARVVHHFEPSRAGQARGKPLTAPFAHLFHLLDRFVDAELKAAVVTAMFAAFVKTPMAPEDVARFFDQDGNRKGAPQPTPRLQPGSIIPLEPGEDVEGFTPNRPSDGFAPFVDAMLRQLASGFGLPVQLLTRDFSGANYASMRSSLVEAWRHFWVRRHALERGWIAPIWGLFVEEMVHAGRIDAPGFYENRAAYERFKAVFPGRGWVDPLKEAQGARVRMEAGLTTLRRECAEQGEDWLEVLQQQARERAARARLGLEASSDAPVAAAEEDEDG